MLNVETARFNGYLLIDKWQTVICACIGRTVNPLPDVTSLGSLH